MLTVRAEVNLDELTASIRQQIRQAVANTAADGAVLWIEAVNKAKLSTYDKDNYIKSIQWGMSGEFRAELFTDYQFAAAIETGRPARDMKKSLQTSSKTRMAKHGKHAGQKYLIIPFRHNTPGNTAHADAMPTDVYEQAKELQKSKVLSMTTRISATGASVPQAVYKWGDRLPAGLAPKLKEHHTTDIYSGMVRFNTSAGKGKSSQYLTFRVMGEWQSDKWIIPPQPGLFLAKAVSAELEKILEAELKNVG